MFRILLVFFLSILTLQVSAQNNSVKKSAKSFNEIVAQTNLSRVVYHEKLSALIDSKANVDSLVYDYYDFWKKSLTETSFPEKVKIKGINKLSNEKAEITIHCIWFDLELGTYLYVSKSTWIKKNKRWYRSGIPDKLISVKKLT